MRSAQAGALSDARVDWALALTAFAVLPAELAALRQSSAPGFARRLQTLSHGTSTLIASEKAPACAELKQHRLEALLHSNTTEARP